MGDDWRVRIALVDLPRELTDDDQVYARGYPASPQEIAAAAAVHAEMGSYRQALIPELGSRLGDQVAVGSSGTEIFLYASSAGSADEAARVAREVLARHDVSAPVRIERWSSWDEEWLDATDKPAADVAAEQQAEHEYLQEHERETSVTTGRPAWAMTVELRSRRDAVALAGHLAAQGWRVRRLRKDLIVWADCEDDAKGLDRALSGDAYTAFRVRRVSYGRNIPLGPPPQGPLIFGPLVRNLSSPDQQNSQVTAPHHRLRPNRVLSQDSRQPRAGQERADRSHSTRLHALQTTDRKQDTATPGTDSPKHRAACQLSLADLAASKSRPTRVGRGLPRPEADAGSAAAPP